MLCFILFYYYNYCCSGKILACLFVHNYYYYISCRVHVCSPQSCLTLCDPVQARQAPLSMGFFRQEYWSGLPYPPPEDLPNPEIEPVLLHPLHWQVCSLPLTPPGKSIKCTVIAKSITCTSTIMHIFSVKIDSNIVLQKFTMTHIHVFVKIFIYLYAYQIWD